MIVGDCTSGIVDNWRDPRHGALGNVTQIDSAILCDGQDRLVSGSEEVEGGHQCHGYRWINAVSDIKLGSLTCYR